MEQQNINTGVYEFTSNTDHIYIEGTEENDIELLSLKGNTEINTNSCTYERFREGLNNQLYYFINDYYNKYYSIYGTRFIYDSRGEVHETIAFKQSSVGGIYSVLPNQLKNQDSITVKIKIYENTLESTDIAKIQFINMNWDIKSLMPGEHTNTVKMSVANSSTWLLESYARPEVIYFSITNKTEKNKRFDFEITEILLNSNESIDNNTDEFQLLDLEKITVQESNLDKINEYVLSNDTASRINIINKKIIDIEKILI